MSRSKVSINWTIILVAIAACLLFCGWCALTAYSEFTWMTRCMFGRGLCVRLFVDGDSRVGKIAKLRVEIDPRGLRTSAEVKVNLPSGIELVQDNPNWQENFPLGMRSSRSVSIRVLEPGEWEVNAWAYATQYGAHGNDTVYIRSSFTSSEVSDRPLPNNWHSPTQPMIAWPAAQVDDRFSGALTFSAEPRLGQPLIVTYTVSAMVPVQDASFVFLFPPQGFEIVGIQFPEGARNIYKYSGQFSWVASLPSAQPINFVATFRITDIGNGYVVGFLQTPSGAIAPVNAYLKVNQFAGSVDLKTPVFVTPTKR